MIVRSGTCFGALFGQKLFFRDKVASRSVFFASCSVYRILVRFLVDFLRPGTTKTQILAESGIKIKKITESHPEPFPGTFLGSNLAQFWTLWAQLERLWPKNALQKACQNKDRKKGMRRIWSGGGSAL